VISNLTEVWESRNVVLQSIYVSPATHQVLQEEVIHGQSIHPDLQQFIEQHDMPWLVRHCTSYYRGAGTRYFNLSSTRHWIHIAIEEVLDDVRSWLETETTGRFTFDHFGEEKDSLVGFGIMKNEPAKLRSTKTLRVVLQRMPEKTYVLWTAYPLLSPRSQCWADEYNYES
jgi:hypothetical protein